MTKPKTTQQTIQYHGRACSKADIVFELIQNEKKRPREQPENCCYSNCRICVFDVFEEDMSKYKSNRNEIEKVLFKFDS